LFNCKIILLRGRMHILRGNFAIFFCFFSDFQTKREKLFDIISF
jgi:hypothetical protein